MKKISKKLAISSLILLLISINKVNAATVDPPGRVEAGTIDKSNIDNARFNSTNKNLQPRQTEVQIKSSPVDSEETPAVLHITRFEINKVIFTGNTIFKTSELEKYSTDIIGKKVTIDDIKAITTKITQLYRSNGYLTSMAFLPPQKIENGILEITVLEGKIGDIKIEGNNWVKTSYLKNNILKGNKFQENKIFNVNNLKKSIGDINGTDYLKGQIILQKGEKRETTDIILKVKDRPPLGFGINWDNQGRDLIGIQRATINLSDYNITGFGDSLSASTSFAANTFGLYTGYNIPLGDKGTELRLGYSLSNIKLGGRFDSDDITGNSQGADISLIQPLYKNNSLNITTDMSFDLRHTRTLTHGSRLENYELRVLRNGFNIVNDDHSGRWISRAEFSTGLPILGASDDSRYGVGSGKFFKMNANLIRVQVLPHKMLGIVKLSGQYSPDTLKAVEQMQLGGMYTVRGFDEGTLLGDVGYNTNIELRAPIPFLPEKISIPYLPENIKNIKIKDRIQFATFYDHGFALPIHQGRGDTYRNFLQSIGFGLRIQLSKLIMANLNFGFPLGKDRYEEQKAIKFHFSLSSDLF